MSVCHKKNVENQWGIEGLHHKLGGKDGFVEEFEGRKRHHGGILGGSGRHKGQQFWRSGLAGLQVGELEKHVCCAQASDSCLFYLPYSIVWQYTGLPSLPFQGIGSCSFGRAGVDQDLTVLELDLILPCLGIVVACQGSSPPLVAQEFDGEHFHTWLLCSSSQHAFLLSLSCDVSGGSDVATNPV